jgi:nucleoid DNA-binding protein
MELSSKELKEEIRRQVNIDTSTLDNLFEVMSTIVIKEISKGNVVKIPKLCKVSMSKKPRPYFDINTKKMTEGISTRIEFRYLPSLRSNVEEESSLTPTN